MEKNVRELERLWEKIKEDKSAKPLEKIKCLNNLLWSIRKEDIQRGIEIGKELDILLKEQPDKGEELKKTSSLAEITMRQGKFRDAYELSLVVIEKAGKIGREDLIPYGYSSLGGAYWYLGNLSAALDAFQKQLESGIAAGDKTIEAEAMNNMGLILDMKNSSDEALIQLGKALNLYVELDDWEGQGLVMNNMAMLSCAGGKYQEAMELAKRALRMCEICHNENTRLAVLDTLGEIHMSIGENDQAMAYFKKCYELADRTGAESDKGMCLLQIGRVHIKEGRPHEGADSIKEGLVIFEECEQNDRIFESCLLLSAIYEKSDPALALGYYKKYHEAKESFEKEDSEEKIKNLQYQFEIEQAKKENRDLQNALDKVKQLSGLLPLCSQCKKVRNDEGYWQDVSLYIKNNSEADISHGLCPDCAEELYPGLLKDKDKTQA